MKELLCKFIIQCTEALYIIKSLPVDNVFQCTLSAFTVFQAATPFRAMQSICFYRFSSRAPFTGNAKQLLLPFFKPRPFFGQCKAAAFTVFQAATLFRAMQSSCFYRFPSLYHFWGNAVKLLITLGTIHQAIKIHGSSFRHQRIMFALSHSSPHRNSGIQQALQAQATPRSASKALLIGCPEHTLRRPIVFLSAAF